MNHFCHQASRLSSDALEHPLSWSDRIKLRLHLMMCGSCRHYHHSTQLLQATIHKICNDELRSQKLPEQRKKEIIEACKNEQQNQNK